MRTLALLLTALIPVCALAGDADNEVKAGKAVYEQTCVVCHGANGKGAIPGVVDLRPADGPLAKSDEALVASIRDGVQSAGSPLAMPAKGGNPTLSEEDIEAVIAYLRAAFGKQNKEAKSSESKK